MARHTIRSWSKIGSDKSSDCALFFISCLSLLIKYNFLVSSKQNTQAHTHAKMATVTTTRPRRCDSESYQRRPRRSGRRATNVRCFSENTITTDNIGHSSLSSSSSSLFDNSFNNIYNNNHGSSSSLSYNHFNNSSRSVDSSFYSSNNSSCSSIATQVLTPKESTMDQIYVSDAAYVDCFLNNSNNNINIDLRQFKLENSMKRYFYSDNKSYRIEYKHSLRYKGDLVWTLETYYTGSFDTISGQSSSCHITMDGYINVRINRKSRHGNTSSSTSNSSSSRHTRKFKLNLYDIARRAAELYEQEAIYQLQTTTKSSPKSTPRTIKKMMKY